MIWKAFVMALRHMVRNAMRSVLTTLGILIGVAAVIAMVSLGRGATEKVTGELASLGRNLLFVMPGSQPHGPSSGGAASRPFVLDDAHAIARDVPDVAGVAPTASRGVVAVAGGQTWRTAVTGTDASYLAVLDWQIAEGRPISEVELAGGAAVVVLGDRVRRELFGMQDPIDATVRVSNVAYRVVGTLRPKGQSTFGQDQDDFMLVPLRTFQRRISGNAYLSFLFVSATSSAATAQVKRDIELLLRERRHIRAGEEDDFYVRDMKEIQQMVGGITSVLTTLLAAIAAVSLLVGGIGIMNIMLVAVTERTREVGIRMAIGARARDVLQQFLVEAIVLSAFGGVAGIGVGLGASFLATRKLALPFVVDPSIVAIAFGFSTLVGVVFGFFPARKAARLQPIEALRYE
jgi:putative ABC transport system permease protein